MDSWFFKKVLGIDGAKQIAAYLKSQGVKLEFLVDEGTVIVKDAFPGLKKSYALWVRQKPMFFFQLNIYHSFRIVMVEGTSRQCKRNWNICRWFCSLQNGCHLSCFKGKPHPEWSVRGEKCGVESRENGSFFAWVSTLSFAVIGFILPHSQKLPSWGKKEWMNKEGSDPYALQLPPMFLAFCS